MGTASLLAGELLGSRNARVRVVEVEINGKKVRVGVRQVSIKQRNELRRIATSSNPDAGLRADVQAVIDAAVDPDTLEPLFERAHFDSLLAQPSGGWVDVVAREAALMMRGPSGVRCEAKVGDGDNAHECSTELVPGALHCHMCGASAPDQIESVEKN